MNLFREEFSPAAEGEWQPIDRHFASFLLRLEGGNSEALRLAGALLSRDARAGSTYLDLRACGGLRILVPDGEDRESVITAPDGEEWCRLLREMDVVGDPESCLGQEPRPLVLDGRGRLYLFRFWHQEQRVAGFWRAAFRRPPDPLTGEAPADRLQHLFPGDTGSRWADDQKLAALAGLFRPVLVITGGPGTGKTWTAVRLLALLLECRRKESLRIALAAPTAKAAVRLREAAAAEEDKLGLSCEAAGLWPRESFTLHRLLGYSPRTASCRYDRRNPLPYDVVVVDEASMVDLAMMERLTEALPERARLILLGDQDQLASVEPGCVFGDLCGGRRDNAFSPKMVRLLHAAGFPGPALPVSTGGESPWGDSIVVLRQNRRFGPDSGIAALSCSIREGQEDRAWEILQGGRYTDVQWVAAGDARDLETRLVERLLEGFLPALGGTNARDCLDRLQEFRVLCALRRSPFGVEWVNSLLERLLEKRGWALPAGEWYPGRPVVITANDYSLRLFNGDLGVCFREDIRKGSEEEANYRVYFPDEQTGLRGVHPARLTNYEPGYALTVHKSQGSEFDHLLVLLPPESSGLISRELLYTAVTRARTRVEIWGTEKVFREGIRNRNQRLSSLGDSLRAEEK